MPTEPPAKFFVNSGLVSSRQDMFHLLRPVLKQTVSYRYFRAGAAVARGTGWVERLVIDDPHVSTFFTPLSVCINVDSWEHLEFETRPDQLLVYTLVQGDERVVLEYAPVGGLANGEEQAVQQAFQFQPEEYVQMELSGLEPGESGQGESGGEGVPGG